MRLRRTASGLTIENVLSILIGVLQNWDEKSERCVLPLANQGSRWQSEKGIGVILCVCNRVGNQDLIIHADNPTARPFAQPW